MDAQKTIDEVVDSVKSEGLFDEFRKECLEEFENMETYHQLKQRVENHVTSFLSKHKYHDGLQKNTLRTNLRNYVSKSDVLLNSIQQLVDEVLSLKGKSFCKKIDKQVDKHLNKTIPAPNLEFEQSAVVPPADSAAPHHHTLPANDEVENSVNVNIMVEENEKEGLATSSTNDDVAVTDEFTEMEIEEVEMDIGENPECENQQLSLETNTTSIEQADKCGGSGSNSHDGVKIVDTADNEDSQISTDEVKAKRVKSESVQNESMFKPIEIPNENTGSDVVVKEEFPHTEESKTELEYDKVSYTDDKEESNKNVLQSSLNLPPIITEPITDDSNSNDSNYSDNIKPHLDESECRRKSSRVRTLPLKLREVDDLKKDDDDDSLSSNDIDHKDLDDGIPSKGKRGRTRKRPQSAGNPETAVTKNERTSSLSRANIENVRRRKRSPSISKQEEEAINFLTKTDETEVTKSGSVNSVTQKEQCDGRESRDGSLTKSSKSVRDEKYSHSTSQKSELKGDDHKSENEQRYDSKDVKSRSIKEDADQVVARSKKDCNPESGESNYSNVDDDKDKSNRIKKVKNVESRYGKSADRKLHDKKDCGSSGEEKLSGKNDVSNIKKEELSSDEEQPCVKKDKSDFGAGEGQSGKGDADRKSRTKKEESSQDERDRNTQRRKRPHSPPVVQEAEDIHSKRSRRPIKQRQRYSP